MSCRPISKTKTWRLVRIVIKGTQIDTSILEGEASKMFEKKKEEAAAAGVQAEGARRNARFKVQSTRARGVH